MDFKAIRHAFFTSFLSWLMELENSPVSYAPTDTTDTASTNNQPATPLPIAK